MLQKQGIKFTEPQDKHGLLAHSREEKAPDLLEQLEAILAEYHVESIFNCTCEPNSYTSKLRAKGWQVFTPDEPRKGGKYDAVICMNTDFVQFLHPGDRDDCLQSMGEMISRDGVVVFCTPDFEPLVENPEDKVVTPLLLGKDWNGTRCSIIRHMSHDTVLDRVVVDYIYHLQDLSTGNITVDWETAACELLSIETAYEAIKYVQWDIRGNYLVGQDRLYVYGHEPYIGPTSVRRNKG